MIIDELTWYDDLSSKREFIRGVNYRLRGDYWTGCPEGGKDQAGGFVDIRHICGLCIRGSWSIPNNFRVRNEFIRVLLQYQTNHQTNGLEGGGSMFDMLGGGVDQRITYSYSLHFSDKFLCINYFNPSYGLKDINFISLIEFKSIKNIFYLLLLFNI